MGDETKRIGVEVPTETWRDFKSECFWRMETMTEVLTRAIEEYIKGDKDEKNVESKVRRMEKED